MLLVVVAVISGATWYFLTPEERGRFLHAVKRTLVRLEAAGIRAWHARDPLTDALRARTRWTLVVPAFAVINVVLSARMMLDPVGVNTDTLIAWGSNFAPRTGNNEWWRLVSAAFVHPSVLALTVNTIALLSAGRLLERLVGSLTFAAVYVMAAVMGSLASLWISPVAVSHGASAAVFGLYGLLLACWMWWTFQRATTTVRLASVKRLAVPAIFFICYNLATHHLETRAEIAGLVTGFTAGLLLCRGAAERKPSLRRVAAAMATAALLVFTLSEPVRGIVDARPDIAQVMGTEERTAAAYGLAVVRFQKGWATPRELSDLIERTIVPALQSANRRVKALGRVPLEHRDVVAAAKDYLRLREEAWRVRARALQKSNLAMLREADRKEQMALEAYGALTTSASRIPAGTPR